MKFVNYSDYHYNDYAFNFNDNWKKYLDEHGFVVIKNILNHDVCENFKKKLWKSLKSLSDNNLDDPIYKKYAKNYPYSLHGGMYNIGHTKTQWAARFRCKKVYEKIWNDKDLITSFDKFCYCPKERVFQKQKLSAWLHSDQSPLNNITSYQGLLCLTDNTKLNSGGFVCIPKTNLIHKEICKENGDENNKQDWIKLTDEFKEKYITEDNVLKVKNKVGDFVLWDSKTIHSGTVPRNTRELGYDRVCIYICMRPRKEAVKRTLTRRIQSFVDKRNTTHNPVNFKLFEKKLGRHSSLSYEEILKRLRDNNLLVEDIEKIRKLI